MKFRRSTGEIVVRIDPRYFRPAEVETLLGDPSKAHEIRLDTYNHLGGAGCRDG